MNQDPSSSDFFSFWSVAPEAGQQDGSLEFGAPEAVAANEATAVPAVEMPIFRLNLEADSQAANLQLERIEAGVQASSAALDAMPARLDTLVEETQARGTAELSFGLAEAELAPPESEALSLLFSIEQQAVSPEGISYGLELPSWGKLGQVVSDYQTAVQKMLRLFAHLAWVETQVQGVLLGRTVVGWTGGMDTAWGKAAVPEQFQLHRRTLAIAIKSHTTVVRLFFLVAQGAAKLSLLLTNPASSILALPVAWKFANQLLAEISQYRELSA